MKTVGKFSKHIVGAIYNIIVIGIVIIAGLIALSTFDTPLKFRLFAVLSGSMEPGIPMGSLVVVMPQDGYAEGDVITVRGEKNPKETVTHRIIDVEKGAGARETQYTLQGDANEEPDQEMIPSSRIIGRVEFHIPYIGKAISFAQTQQGFIAMIVIPATILLYSEAIAAKNEVVKMFQKKEENGHQQMVVITPPRNTQKPIPVIKESAQIKKPVTPVKKLQPIYESPQMTVPQIAQQKIEHVLHIEGQDKKVRILV